MAKETTEGTETAPLLSRLLPVEFMERPLAIFAVHWDHEPVRIPLNRPPGTFSPTGGEGWDEGGTVHGKSPAPGYVWDMPVLKRVQEN